MTSSSKTHNLNLVLVVILLAQFIIVIDTTFMNVSISTLVTDFHTTATSIQNAITLYALVMAAFMIAGAKFGDIIGRKRAFTLGLVIYAVGTFVTSIAPSLPLFMIGWCLLEGLGAAIMLPAMMSLIVGNFPEGAPRAKAYAAFAALAGIAAGVGPIIGGFFTTFLSWRLAFFSELIIAFYIYFNRRIIKDAPYTGAKPTFDWLGFIMSAIGLATLVEGIVLGSAYGLIKTRKDVTIAGYTLLHAGQLAPTIWLVLLGLVILGLFVAIETRRRRQQRQTLLDIALLKIGAVRSGSSVQLMQNVLITGVIFSVSLYLQMQLGYSAILSGISLLPLSLMVLASASLSNRVMSHRFAPRTGILAGFAIAVLGVLALGLFAPGAASGTNFVVGLALIGLGIGMVGSQNQNLIMSSVAANKSNETSGIVNTAQNIGTSLGTSLAGAIILSIFVSTATGLVDASSSFTASQKQQANHAITEKAQIVSNQTLTAATQAFEPLQQQAILSINDQARQQSLSYVYFGLGLVSLLGLVAASRLPHTKPLAASAASADAN